MKLDHAADFWHGKIPFFGAELDNLFVVFHFDLTDVLAQKAN